MLVKSRLKPQLKANEMETGSVDLAEEAAHQKAHTPFRKATEDKERIEHSRRY